MRYLFLIIFIIQIQFACGQKEIACINNFKKLLEISKKDSISIEDLNRSIKLKEIIFQCNNVIYFEEDYTFEQMYMIAEKLNVERQNYNN